MSSGGRRGTWSRQRRFVVGHVGEHAAGAFEAVAEGGPRMTDEVGGDGEPGNLEGAPGGVVELQPAGQVPQPDGEQRRGQVAGEAGVEALRRRRRTPQVHLEVLLVQRPEEAEAEDVVHVEVGEQHVDPPQLGGLPVDVADARPGVEDGHAAVDRPHLHARRVAAVPGRFRPGARQGSPAPRRTTFTGGEQPEDGQRAEVGAALTFEGEGGDGQVAGDAVEPLIQKLPWQWVRLRPPPPAGDPRGGTAAEAVGGREDRAQLLERHLAGLLVAVAEDLLGRFVVKEQVAVGVDQEHRRREVPRHLLEKDQFHRLLGHRLHRRVLRPSGLS